MTNTKKVLLGLSAVGMLLLTGCAQKVQIKALAPAEVGEMASKKKVAVASFKHDKVGLSGNIEAQIAKKQLDKKRYFTVLSRKDMNKIIAEQKLQSSDSMDSSTSARVGKLLGAQAIIAGEVTDSSAQSDKYQEAREKCISRYKNGECARIKHYKVTCNTTQASVSANINIIDVENGSIIYADTFTKSYNADSCKDNKASLGFVTMTSAPGKIMSKKQAIQKLTNDIASEFVYKLTPKYIYFKVGIFEEIELETATDKQKKNLEVSLQYVKAGRMDKAKKILVKLLDELKGQSYAVAYDLGVVNEATGKFDEAKKLYTMADELTVEPVDEINLAMTRIDALIAKRDEAQKQMNR